MKLLCWTCWGMNKPPAVRTLLEIQERVHSDVLFLSETHVSKAKAGKLMRRLKFDEMEILESNGRSGGLLMLWHSGLNVTSREVHFIDIWIDEISDMGWCFTASMVNQLLSTSISVGAIFKKSTI